MNFIERGKITQILVVLMLLFLCLFPFQDATTVKRRL
jgi:hypothetical protein